MKKQICFLAIIINSLFYRAAKYDVLLNEFKISDTSFFATAYSHLSNNLAAATPGDKILIRLQLGQIAASRKQEKLAGTYFYRALTEANSVDNRDLLFLCYYKLGTFYYSFKAPPAIVVKYLYTAKKLYSNSLYKQAYIRLLRLIGYLELEATQNFNLAEQTYFELLQLMEEKDESVHFGGVYNNLGILYTEKGNFELAEKYLNKSLALRKQTTDSIAIAQSYENLGTTYREKGELDKALQYYDTALGIQRRQGRKSAIQESEINVGITLKKKKEFAKARSLLENALNKARAGKYMEFQLRILPALAECYAALNEFDKAYDCLNLLKAIESALKSETTQDNILRYNIESSLGKKLFEDSLRYSQRLMKVQFENEKQLSLQHERSKRDILSFILLASLMITVALVFYLVNKQKNRLQLKNSEIKALQAQMNPHFIFNSLNSVMEYIRQSEKDKALQYLTKFSRLIRLVLELSAQKTISLEQEIEMLRYYIDLENLRFGNRFMTSINCSDDVDTESIEIPGMMIQPFVENAILHGLRNQLKIADENNLSYQPRLEVEFSILKDLVRCTVRDNGAGRKKAAEMKQANTFGQKSLGVRITGNRLELIGDKIHKLVYRDLLDAHGQACGTEVEILIPLEIKY